MKSQSEEIRQKSRFIEKPIQSIPGGEKVTTIAISVIASAITAKIVATYYFKKVDGYVKAMCEMTEKSNKRTVAILNKFHKNFHQEE